MSGVARARPIKPYRLMDKDWTLAYTTNTTWKANIIKQVLEDGGVDAVIINKQDSSYLVGDVEIFVKNSELTKAHELLKNTHE